jgi:hypothetical protein
MGEGRTIHVTPGERAVHALLAGKRLAASNLSKDGLRNHDAGGHRGGNKKTSAIHHVRLH